MTVYNRKAKTLRCLETLCGTLAPHDGQFQVAVYLTDDGCTDGTADAIRGKEFPVPVHILQGDTLPDPVPEITCLQCPSPGTVFGVTHPQSLL